MQYRTWQLCTVAVTVAVTSHVSTAVLFQLSIQCAMIVFILHRYLIDWHSMSAAASVHQISMAKRSVRDDLDDQEEAAFDAAILINDKLTGILPVDVTKKQKVDSKQIIRPVSSPLRSAPECNVMSALSGALCSNCKRRPVAAVTNCFADWCHQCDVSLWATRSSVECDSSSSSIHHSLSVEIHPSLSDPESGNLAVDLNGSRLRSQSVEHARAIVGISPHLYGYYQRAEFWDRQKVQKQQLFLFFPLHWQSGGFHEKSVCVSSTISVCRTKMWLDTFVRGTVITEKHLKYSH